MITNIAVPFHPYAKIFFDTIRDRGGGDLYPYEKIAIDNFVIDLLFYNLWDFMVLLYPFVGRNGTAHGVNLKKTNNNTMIWSSASVTHNAMGITSSGASGNSGLNLGLAGIFANNLSFGLYCRTNTGESADQLNATASISLRTRSATDTATFEDPNVMTVSNTAAGLFVSNRTSSSSHQGWINGSLVVTEANSQGTIPSNGLFTTSAGTTKNNAFTFVGLGLTDEQNINFYKAVQKLQMGLMREV